MDMRSIFEENLRILRDRIESIACDPNLSILSLIEVQEQYNRVLHSYMIYKGEDPAA
jgi:hypothetical protein